MCYFLLTGKPFLHAITRTITRTMSSVNACKTKLLRFVHNKMKMQSKHRRLYRSVVSQHRRQQYFSFRRKLTIEELSVIRGNETQFPVGENLKVIYHPLYGMNNYVLIWDDWLSCDPLRGSHDSQSPPYKETLVPHLVTTLIYLSQNYSYYIRGDISSLNKTT